MHLLTTDCVESQSPIHGILVSVQLGQQHIKLAEDELAPPGPLLRPLRPQTDSEGQLPLQSCHQETKGRQADVGVRRRCIEPTAVHRLELVGSTAEYGNRISQRHGHICLLLRLLMDMDVVSRTNPIAAHPLSSRVAERKEDHDAHNQHHKKNNRHRTTATTTAATKH